MLQHCAAAHACSQGTPASPQVGAKPWGPANGAIAMRVPACRASCLHERLRAARGASWILASAVLDVRQSIHAKSAGPCMSILELALAFASHRLTYAHVPSWHHLQIVLSNIHHGMPSELDRIAYIIHLRGCPLDPALTHALGPARARQLPPHPAWHWWQSATASWLPQPRVHGGCPRGSRGAGWLLSGCLAGDPATAAQSSA